MTGKLKVLHVSFFEVFSFNMVSFIISCQLKIQSLMLKVVINQQLNFNSMTKTYKD